MEFKIDVGFEFYTRVISCQASKTYTNNIQLKRNYCYIITNPEIIRRNLVLNPRFLSHFEKNIFSNHAKRYT